MERDVTRGRARTPLRAGREESSPWQLGGPWSLAGVGTVPGRAYQTTVPAASKCKLRSSHMAKTRRENNMSFKICLDCFCLQTAPPSSGLPWI